MSPRTPRHTSEEAQEALVTQLEDLLESLSNLKPERAADMLITALEIEGFKIVPLTDEERRAK